MNRSLLETQLPELVKPHVPRNVRGFKYRIIDGLPQPSMLGMMFDPKPFDGKVVALTDEAIIVKTARTQFAVIDRDLATAVPDAGAKVFVRPYARRRFDGLRADTPEERTEIGLDGKSYTYTTQILGAAPAKLPVSKPQCPELAQLIEQLENLPAPDGFRKITHLLVDANARDFSLVDPKPDDMIRTPPAIDFTVAEQLDKGIDVLITNPELVKTGLDLLEFPTIVFMQSGYNVYSLQQAARRSWRIGQKQPVRVVYLGYAASSQMTCLELMAKKIMVSQSTSGDVPESGLDVLNQDGDSVEVALARQLVTG